MAKKGFWGAGFSTMTEAFNAVGSTLGLGAQKLFGDKKMKAAVRRKKLGTPLKKMAKNFGKSWDAGTFAPRAGMIAGAISTPLVTAAAADFLNPWGIGWGD